LTPKAAAGSKVRARRATARWCGGRNCASPSPGFVISASGRRRTANTRTARGRTACGEGARCRCCGRCATPRRIGYLGNEVFGQEDPEPLLQWQAALLLAEAGLISGRVTSEGIDTVRVTLEGQQALDPLPRDPIDEAEAALRNGNVAEALVTAVELALRPRLEQLADAHDIETADTNARPVRLARIIDALKAKGPLSESQRAQVDAWLKLRNDAAHPGGAQPVSAGTAAAALTGIRAFLADLAEDQPPG
jgi:hypothetical protein